MLSHTSAVARRRPRMRHAAVLAALVFGLVATALGLAALIRSTPRSQPALVAGRSMEPTIPQGTILYYAPMPERIERGQIVAISLQHGNYRLLASRVVGIPGETVEVRDGALLIDGHPPDQPDPGAPRPYRLAPLHLDADKYFVLGDNRDDSVDSHVFGPVPRQSIVGVVVS